MPPVVHHDHIPRDGPTGGRDVHHHATVAIKVETAVLPEAPRVVANLEASGRRLGLRGRAGCGRGRGRAGLVVGVAPLLLPASANNKPPVEVLALLTA